MLESKSLRIRRWIDVAFITGAISGLNWTILVKFSGVTTNSVARGVIEIAINELCRSG